MENVTLETTAKMENVTLEIMAKEAYKLKQQISEFEARHKALMENLKRAAGGAEARFGNYKLGVTVRVGVVDYSSIPQLRSVNLEAYRKPGIVVYKLEFLGE